MSEKYEYSISGVYSAQVEQQEQHIYTSNSDVQHELDFNGEVTATQTTYTINTSDGSGDWYNSNGTIWTTDPTWVQPGIPQQPTDNTVYVPSVWTYPDENMNGEWYPKLPNSLGVIYVEDGEIRCRTPEGQDILLGKMDDGDDEVSINIIATIAKRLLEKPSEEAI